MACGRLAGVSPEFPRPAFRTFLGRGSM